MSLFTLCLFYFELSHVQNSTWATKFLIRKFRINDNDDIAGHQEFAQWLMQEKPKRRAGKQLPVGKSWKTTADPWRRVTKCSFGLDYMKCYPFSDTEMEDRESCVSGLIGYDDNGTHFLVTVKWRFGLLTYADNPVQRYNVYSQRLSVYVQYVASDIQAPGPDIASPYQDLERSSRPLDVMYDNGSTIIIFDNSETCSVHDSLISARGEWEIRWRRLPFYITSNTYEDDERMTLDCMKAITQGES